MFAALMKGAGHTATINGKQIKVEPGETLLQAALRENIEFPNVCRVGGCGSCKCRLVEGRVKEMTETGYLLTEDEIEEGYILACQSAPKTDIKIDVDLSTAVGGHTVRGRIIGKTLLTHDICRLDLQLDEALPYQAGQFAELALASLPGVKRSYSFATPPSADGKARFIVRRIQGGQLSSRLVDDNVVGEDVQLHGPGGSFWLRAGSDPVLMIAGGSGLAPILAIIEQMQQNGDARPVTVLFGAREQKDLYALDTFERLEKNSPNFKFVPVLSAEPAGSSWRGERGLVVDVIAKYKGAAQSAYLCGPPAMVDAAIAFLKSLNMQSKAIFADRFTPRAAVNETGFSGGVVEARRTPARFVDYLKFFLFHVIALAAASVFILGGESLPIGLAIILGFYVVGDAVCGNDTSVPKFKHPGLLTAQLWMALPLLSAVLFVSVWSICSTDPLGFGAFVQHLTGYNALAARAATSWLENLAGIVLTFLMIGVIGTITAHELTHRTWEPVSMIVGRLLLAFSFDTAFAIEHVYGHHRYVSTTHDPATAPRGRNVYFHVLSSTWRGNVSAWKIECERLRRKRLAIWSLHNAYLRGQLMSLGLVLIALAMGGWRAALYFVVCACLAKALLEIVNYMEHYGIVRIPELPVQPRHSWNTNARISSWAMFNLTRHSHHHAQGEVPYQDLMPLPDAPMMIGGYLTTIIVAIIPPLWHAVMIPKVIAWDRDYASPEERVLAKEANLRSGIMALKRYNPLDLPPAHK